MHLAMRPDMWAAAGAQSEGCTLPAVAAGTAGHSGKTAASAARCSGERATAGWLHFAHHAEWSGCVQLPSMPSLEHYLPDQAQPSPAACCMHPPEHLQGLSPVQLRPAPYSLLSHTWNLWPTCSPLHHDQAFSACLQELSSSAGLEAGSGRQTGSPLPLSYPSSAPFGSPRKQPGGAAAVVSAAEESGRDDYDTLFR